MNRDAAGYQAKHSRRAAKGLVSACLALAVLGVLAPAAWAHTGTATISCRRVAYAFADFPAKPGNTVHENVFMDGLRITSDTFTFNGSTGGNHLQIDVIGEATVEAKARWSTNGAHGSFEVTRLVTGCVIG
jgi:hypothetical protein